MELPYDLTYVFPQQKVIYHPVTTLLFNFTLPHTPSHTYRHSHTLERTPRFAQGNQKPSTEADGKLRPDNQNKVEKKNVLGANNTVCLDELALCRLFQNVYFQTDAFVLIVQ